MLEEVAPYQCIFHKVGGSVDVFGSEAICLLTGAWTSETISYYSGLKKLPYNPHRVRKIALVEAVKLAYLLSVVEGVDDQNVQTGCLSTLRNKDNRIIIGDRGFIIINGVVWRLDYYAWAAVVKQLGVIR